MVAETAPDVFINHTQQMPKYQQLGQILDISKYAKRDHVDMSAYQDGLAGLFQGKEGKGLYGLPKDWDTEVLQQDLPKAGRLHPERPVEAQLESQGRGYLRKVHRPHEH